MSTFLTTIQKLCKSVSTITVNIPKRNYALLKRFYRKTGILYSDGKYEITLDQRKLKTPNGNLFLVESEPLALAVATEWDAQKEKIERSSMHLTALCSTVIDNPNNLTKEDIVNYIINYLDTDTILFHCDDTEELYAFQSKEWDPVIDWFNNKFNVNVSKSCDIIKGPMISSETKSVINKHLMSYDFAAINGYVFAVDTLKSVILSLACVERFLTPEKAVFLSRVEEEFQLEHWGRVQWAHDLSQQELQARLAAALLFIHFNSSSTLVRSKVVGRL